jgi:hypothetical protein
MLHTGDLEHDLVEMPFVADAREPATDPAASRGSRCRFCGGRWIRTVGPARRDQFFKDRLMAPLPDFPRRESRRAIETLRPAKTPASSAVPNLRIHLPPAGKSSEPSTLSIRREDLRFWGLSVALGHGADRSPFLAPVRTPLRAPSHARDARIRIASARPSSIRADRRHVCTEPTLFASSQTAACCSVSVECVA